MVETTFSIGEVSRKTGCKPPTIRYYEAIGLFGAAGRTEGGHRTYGAEDIRRLAFIRRGRELGFSLDGIRSLLDLSADPERSCADVDALATEHLAEIQSKIAALSAMRDALEDLLEQCHRTTIVECRVLDALVPTYASH